MPRFCDTIASFWFMLGSHQPIWCRYITYLHRQSVWFLPVDPFYEVSRTPHFCVGTEIPVSSQKKRFAFVYLQPRASPWHSCILAAMLWIVWDGMCELGTGKKARVENAVLLFASYQDVLNRSKISVICSLWPDVLLCVLCVVPQECFFCWMWRRSDFFFRYTAYQQPWRGLSAKRSNTGCSYKKGPKHCQFMGCLDNPMNSFQLRSG